MKKTIIPLVLFAFFNASCGIPYPQDALPDRIFNHKNDSQEINQTIADLVQKQTDTIKQIVIDQQGEQNQFPYPPKLTKPDPDFEADKIREDLDKLSLEELKLKCQHLTRLINVNNRADQPTGESNLNKLSYSKVKIGNHRPISGFYLTNKMTSSTTSTPKLPSLEPPPPTPKPLQNVKYIKLEPVILQKTILSDGRTIYYWHKSLPSALQFNTPRPQSQPLQISTSTPITTTPTSSGYDFRNFFPSFYSLGGSESITEVTTEKTTTTPPTTTTTTTTSTSNPTTEQSEDLLYAQQLRFVVPVPYANVDSLGVKQPWEFDQFAYYPKQLQPQTVNVQVPYVPTFHIIKALAVPNKQEPVKTEDYTSFDNVNI